MITVVGLCRYFGDFCAVSELEFTLCAGEVLGLLGPNGAGKSTTMRMLSGCLAASSGSVVLNGIDLRDQPLQAKQGLGYLPETPPLYDELTVDEYLLFCARLRGIARPGQEQALQRVKRRCGLSESGRRLISHLSKGFRQRVGIAQAIIHDPAVIILDEPTSGLDPNQILEIRSLVRELADDRGVLLSTHILPEVQAVCDRVLIMHEGRLVYSERLEHINRSGGGGLIVRLANPPGEGELAMLPGVTGVSSAGENRFQLESAEDGNPELIAEQIVRNGWGLRELMPAQHSLEQIFSRLTTGTPWSTRENLG